MSYDFRYLIKKQFTYTTTSVPISILFQYLTYCSYSRFRLFITPEISISEMGSGQ